MSEDREICEYQSCEYCHDTGYYGDHGPGIEGNNEYHECDMCTINKYTTLPSVWVEKEQLKAEVERLKKQIKQLTHNQRR
jgi:hypothetical protein